MLHLLTYDLKENCSKSDVSDMLNVQGGRGWIGQNFMQFSLSHTVPLSHIRD